MSDGAGAVLLMKRSLAIQKGLPVLGVFRYDFSSDIFTLELELEDYTKRF